MKLVKPIFFTCFALLLTFGFYTILSSFDQRKQPHSLIKRVAQTGPSKEALKTDCLAEILVSLTTLIYIKILYYILLLLYDRSNDMKINEITIDFPTAYVYTCTMLVRKIKNNRGSQSGQLQSFCTSILKIVPLVSFLYGGIWYKNPHH